MGSFLRQQLGAAQRVHVADPVLADPVGGVPAGVLPEGMPEPDGAAPGGAGVGGGGPARVEEIEAGGERAIEEPGLGEADRPGLDILAAPDAQEHLPALAEEVALGEVEGAEDAVLGAVAAADREEAGRLLGPVDGAGALVLGGPGRGLGLDLVEVVEVGQPLLGSRELLAREEVALGPRDLTPEDLLPAPGIARAVDSA